MSQQNDHNGDPADGFDPEPDQVRVEDADLNAIADTVARVAEGSPNFFRVGDPVEIRDAVLSTFAKYDLTDFGIRTEDAMFAEDMLGAMDVDDLKSLWPKVVAEMAYRATMCAAVRTPIIWPRN